MKETAKYDTLLRNLVENNGKKQFRRQGEVWFCFVSFCFAGGAGKAAFIVTVGLGDGPRGKGGVTHVKAVGGWCMELGRTGQRMRNQ